MISDEERRKAAANLRGMTEEELSHMFLEEILDCAIGGRCLDDEGDIDERLILNRLADLIDRPTCSMEYRPEWSGDELCPTRAYECSVCGHIVMDGKPDYCPGCGAEVLE